MGLKNDSGIICESQRSPKPPHNLQVPLTMIITFFVQGSPLGGWARLHIAHGAGGSAAAAAGGATARGRGCCVRGVAAGCGA